MIVHQKVCRVTLTQGVLRNRKNMCVLRVLIKNFTNFFNFSINFFFFSLVAESALLSFVKHF